MRACSDRANGPENLKQLVTLTVLFVFSLALTACGGVSGSSNSGNPLPAGGTNHVFLVVLENQQYSDVIGNANMPYLNSLANQYATDSNYHASAHPSLPNYFMLTTGQTITNDDNFSGVVSADNIARELNNAGKTWKVYAESIPSTGYIGPDQFPYVRHHNPFTYFSDVQGSSVQRENIVPLAQLSQDLASGNVPSFSLIVPNDFNNAHTCPAANPNCPLSQLLSIADTWLQDNIGPVLNSSVFQRDGLLVLTFDESLVADTSAGGGHVAFIVAGASVKRGHQSGTFYQHDSTLRMMLKRLGVTSYPGSAASARDMDEFFSQ